MWYYLKRRILERNSVPSTIEQLRIGALDECDAIPQDCIQTSNSSQNYYSEIQTLLSSMPRRMLVFSNFISYRLFLCSENSFEIELRATVTSIASHEIRLS
ncbi:unnamed protein product [Callosobruchus maculatus]|uniref:Uncharacterized protein n=1 Tax=Callosobruchus maculatus TaxID=64391 RepID=A0A653D9F0_CALMS|nr:unnamed protein product [Callosobruchus maculatus]